MNFVGDKDTRTNERHANHSTYNNNNNTNDKLDAEQRQRQKKKTIIKSSESGETVRRDSSHDPIRHGLIERIAKKFCIE